MIRLIEGGGVGIEFLDRAHVGVDLLLNFHGLDVRRQHELCVAASSLWRCMACCCGLSRFSSSSSTPGATTGMPLGS